MHEQNPSFTALTWNSKIGQRFLFAGKDYILYWGVVCFNNSLLVPAISSHLISISIFYVKILLYTEESKLNGKSNILLLSGQPPHPTICLCFPKCTMLWLAELEHKDWGSPSYDKRKYKPFKKVMCPKPVTEESQAHFGLEGKVE